MVHLHVSAAPVSLSSTAELRTPPVERHDSSELTQIRISPPRRRSKHLRSINPLFVENTLLAPCDSCDLTFLVGYSWIVRPVMLLIWRVMIFLYLAITLTFITLSQVPLVYTLSFVLYCAQLVCASVCILSSCVSVFGRRQAFRKRESIRGQTCVRSIDMLTVVLLQNTVALCVYNDIIVWMGDRQAVVDRASFLLVHVYNLLPGLLELAVGCTEFEVQYFLIFGFFMAMVFATTILARYWTWVPAFNQVYIDVWQNNDLGYAVRALTQMGIVSILCCLCVLSIQKLRQMVVRRI